MGMIRAVIAGTALVALTQTGCSVLSPPPGRGIVALAEVTFILSFTQGVAFFFPSQEEPAPIGPCHFRRTKLSPMDGGTAPTLASAGTITYTGLEVPLMLTPSASNAYAGDAKGRSFDAGEAITITASGAEVPPFTSALVAPARVHTDAPSSIARGADTTITWTPDGRAAQFRIFVLGSSGILDCGFDATSGVATVPASALERFDPGDAVTLVPATVTSQMLELDGWQVEALIAQADDYSRGTL